MASSGPFSRRTTQPGSEPVAPGLAGLPVSIGGYPVLERIGSGGMGTVYRAVQERLGRREVAIKVMNHADPDLVKRMEREIEVQGRASSPRIVQLYDSGLDDLGRPFFVMQYCAGGSVSDQVKEHPTGKLRLAEAASVIADTAEALAFLHGTGVVHRDVKPKNIFLTEAGESKLGDFGIVQTGGETTTSSALIGTVLYAAPELHNGAKAKESSDVYSLGVTAYELLAGRPPYEGTTLGIIDAAREGRREPLADLAPNCPSEVCALVESCMDPDPDRRPTDLAGFARTIRGAIDCRPVEIQTGTVVVCSKCGLRQPCACDATQRTTAPGTPPPPTATRKRTPLLIGSAAALLLVVGGGGYWFAKSSNTPAAATATQQHSFGLATRNNLEVATNWTAPIDGTVLTGQVAFSNPTDKPLSGSAASGDVVVTKDAAANISDIAFDTKIAKVVRKDPVARFDLGSLRPGETKTITYTIETSKRLTSSRFKALYESQTAAEAAYFGARSTAVQLTVTVSPKQLDLNLDTNNTGQLKATVTRPDGSKVSAKTAKIAWNTSDPSVAVVNTSGKVTAIASGTATITANSGTASTDATVTVTGSQIAGGTKPPSDTGGSSTTGKVTSTSYKNPPTRGPWQPATPSIAATPGAGENSLVFSFSTTPQTPTDGSQVTYTWNFGDGTTDTGLSTSHTYNTMMGNNVAATVKLTVASNGQQASSTRDIVAKPPSPPTISAVSSVDASNTIIWTVTVQPAVASKWTVDNHADWSGTAMRNDLRERMPATRANVGLWASRTYTVRQQVPGVTLTATSNKADARTPVKVISCTGRFGYCNYGTYSARGYLQTSDSFGSGTLRTARCTGPTENNSGTNGVFVLVEDGWWVISYDWDNHIIPAIPACPAS